jgi:hypothetical protein
VNGFLSAFNRHAAVAVAPVRHYLGSTLLPWLHVQRQVTVWCWAATTAAIATAFRRPTTQCAVATTVLTHLGASPPPDCCRDHLPCRTLADLEVALQLVGHHRQTEPRMADWADITHEITVAARPFALRIDMGGTGHFVAAYGIGQDALRNDFVSLSDPDNITSPTDVTYAGFSGYRQGCTWTHTYWTQP